MKKTMLQFLGPLAVTVLLLSCNGDKGKDDQQNDLKQKAANALKNDSKPDDASSASADGPKEVMTLEQAGKFLSASDANKGKLITINAYPKGTTKSINGEFMLYLSDKNGTGLAAENFACSFKEADREKVRTYKAEDLVKITGNINWNNGVILLKNAKLAE
jgi:hypothetical protein